MKKVDIYRLWLKKLKLWFFEIPPLCIIITAIIAGIVLSFAIAYYQAYFFTKRLDSVLEKSAIFLQLMGTACLGWIIYRKFRHYNPLGYIKEFLEWLIRVPRPREPSSHSINGSVHSVTSISGSVDVRRTPSQDATLEERVFILKESLDRYVNQFNKEQQELNQQLNSLQLVITKEQNERKLAIKSTEAKIQALAVGEIKWEIVGFYWLLIGYILNFIS